MAFIIGGHREWSTSELCNGLLMAQFCVILSQNQSVEFTENA